MKHLILILLTCYSTLLNSQGLLNNLKGCYPFDGNAVNNATTGAMYNGTYGGGVTAANNRFAVPNMAMQLNPGGPSDKIFLYSTGFINGAQILTASLWIQHGGNMNSEIMYHAAMCGVTESWALKTIATGQGPIIQVSTVGNPCGTPVPVSVQSGIVNGAWHHIVFSITTTGITLWVDNTQYSTSYASMPVTWGGNYPIIIGGSSTNGPVTYTGRIDDLRFYDRVLTNSEITDLFTNNPSCNASSGTSPQPAPTVGNYCSAQNNALTGNYQIDLNGFNYNFTSPNNTIGKVVIGKTTCGTGMARLDVLDNVIGNGIYSSCSAPTSNVAIRGVGGNLQFANITDIFGVVGESLLGTNNFTGVGAGVAGFCGPMNSNTMPQGQSIGVYGNSVANGGNWAGYFEGDVSIHGAVWGSQYGWMFSDRRLKKNIQVLDKVSERIKLLNGYTYYYKTDEYKNHNFSEREQFGFIAQELKEVFPQLVNEDKAGFLGVNYVGFIPILLQSQKEQIEKIEAQELAMLNQQRQIDELKALVQVLVETSTGKFSSANNAQSITLENNSTVVLNQNAPNPFAEHTVISYNIPSDFSEAKIIFSSINGVVLKSVDIREKGAGSITVYASNLSNGTYSYSLIIDGITIDTKKMVKE